MIRRGRLLTLIIGAAILGIIILAIICGVIQKWLWMQQLNYAGIFWILFSVPGFMPLPWWQTFTIFAYTMVACLVVNDTVKVAMIKWRVPMAVAEKPLDCTPQKERS